MLERMAETYEQVRARTPRGLPKYLHLCQVIESEIGAGRLGPGDRLPPEAALAEALPASLGTVQKALGALADRGIVVRLHGKGTYVAEPRVEDRYLWHLRFLDERGALLPVYVRVHRVERIERDGPWSDFLGEHDYYVRVRRTMDVNHEFTATGEFVVPGPPFHGLLDIPRERLDGTSLRAVLAERFGTTTLRVGEQIACEPASAPVCAALGLEQGSVVLTCHIFGYGFRDAPVYYQRYDIPPNPRRLEVRESKP